MHKIIGPFTTLEELRAVASYEQNWRAYYTRYKDYQWYAAETSIVFDVELPLVLEASND